MHHNIKAPQNPTTAAAHGFESHQGTVRAGIARDAEQKENTAHDEKTISFLISFEYENFTFTIQNSWPKINAQCRCTASQLRLLLGRAARNNASSNASPLRGVRILQSVSGAVVHGHCRLIQRNQQQNKQDANEHRAISAGSTPSTHPMHSWQREAAATAQ